MMQIDLRSMKTTICAFIGAAAGFVAFTPEHFSPLMVALAKYIMIGGFAAIGIFGKDSSDHSTASEVAKATTERSAEPLPAGTTLNLQVSSSAQPDPSTNNPQSAVKSSIEEIKGTGDGA